MASVAAPYRRLPNLRSSRQAFGKNMLPSLLDELIEPLIIGRAQKSRCSIPKFHRMLRAHVRVECLLVCKGFGELKVVRSRRLAEQGERLDPGIV